MCVFDDWRILQYVAHNSKNKVDHNLLGLSVTYKLSHFSQLPTLNIKYVCLLNLSVVSNYEASQVIFQREITQFGNEKRIRKNCFFPKFFSFLLFHFSFRWPTSPLLVDSVTATLAVTVTGNIYLAKAGAKIIVSNPSPLPMSQPQRSTLTNPTPSPMLLFQYRNNCQPIQTP